MIKCEENLKKLVSYLSKNKQNLNVIFEIGARDCKETLAFNHFYPNSKIFTYECNPNTLSLCRENLIGKSNILLTEKAISDKIGKLTFFPINQEKTKTTWKDGNPGASSLFKAKNENYIEHYVQDEIIIDSSTLKFEFDKHNIDSVDLLWMDIQGAELMALKGAENDLKKIKYIHLEVEFSEIYKNQPLFWEIKKYLNKNEFNLVTLTGVGGHSGDAVFVNSRIIKSPLKKIRHLLNNKFLHLYHHYFRLNG